MQSFFADDAPYTICSILTPEHDLILIRVVSFFRSREDQFLMFPRGLPRRELTGANLKASKISLMQVEKIRLGRFPESASLIRGNIVLHPLRDIYGSHSGSL